MIDPVETALADAIGKAAAGGEWAVVAQLARELEARRVAKAEAEDRRRARGAGNVRSLEEARRGRS